MTERQNGIALLDAVAVGLIAVGVLALWAFQILVVPSFAAMFADFGSHAALPAVTRVVLQPFLAAAATLATLVLMAIGLALRFSSRRGVGAAVLVLAALIPTATVPLMLAAMYAPIFDLAGNIRP